MLIKFFKTAVLLTIILTVGCCRLMAQGDSTSLRPTFSLNFITEVETDFTDSRWHNLLEAYLNVPLSRKFTFNVGALSHYTDNETALIEDLQVFSNIECWNENFALTVAGFTWQMNDRHSLFAGIRRFDEDYFCSDDFSLFTNSSCGGFTTLTYNYFVPTYPYAAMCLHYKYDYKDITFQASLYNGYSYNRFTGRNNVFRICPKTDGTYFMSQLEYRFEDSHYYFGGSLYYGDLKIEGEPYSLRPSLWTYAEQYVLPNLKLLGAYSHAFSKDDVCFDFIGLGARYILGPAEFGFFTDYTRVEDVPERATEFTCKLNINDWLSIQPVFHIIHTNEETDYVGVLRFNVEL